MEIKVEHLCKTFGRQKVLQDLSLTIPTGIYGLLGKNGAGKTTFLRILATLEKPDGGSVRLDGVPIQNQKEIRKCIGYLPQEFAVYPTMRVSEALDYLGILAGLPRGVRWQRIDFLLGKLHLEREKKKRFRELSGGMKRRFGLAQALLSEPKILLLDEPTAGLDPKERVRIGNLLLELARERIVLISSHITGDIEAICSNAAVLHQGRVIFSGSISELKHMADGKVYAEEVGILPAGPTVEDAYMQMLCEEREDI